MGVPYLQEGEKRVAATFSLRAERLKWFRQALAIELGHEPSHAECVAAMRHIAQQGVDAYIKQHIEIEGAIIL